MNHTVYDLYDEISELRIILSEISESLSENKSEDDVKIMTISKRMDDLIDKYIEMKKSEV